ncbi:MAG: protein kinase [Polyangiaceae bacterium]|nr:protein kinase [Polyangiaceae bacterium]
MARKRLNANWASDPGAQARFGCEIELLRAMEHPNIVPLCGVSISTIDRSYCMPLYPSTLRRQLAEGVHYSVGDVLALARSIASALDYAHALGFTHRDLKPDNILIDDEGRPIICDWGLGQFIHKHSKVLQLTVGGPMGTEYYCDLEQWNSGNGGTLGDVYSLGMTLAEVARGRAIQIRQVGFGITEDVLQPHTSAAVQLNQLFRRMTSLSRASRCQSMGEVLVALSWIA